MFKPTLPNTLTWLAVLMTTVNTYDASCRMFSYGSAPALGHDQRDTVLGTAVSAKGSFVPDGISEGSSDRSGPQISSLAPKDPNVNQKPPPTSCSLSAVMFSCKIPYTVGEATHTAPGLSPRSSSTPVPLVDGPKNGGPSSQIPPAGGNQPKSYVGLPRFTSYGPAPKPIHQGPTRPPPPPSSRQFTGASHAIEVSNSVPLVEDGECCYYGIPPHD